MLNLNILQTLKRLMAAFNRSPTPPSTPIVVPMKLTPPYTVQAGKRYLPGAKTTPEGVNFCVFSQQAVQVELLLYADAESVEPMQVITLDPEHNRTFFFWHVLVENLPTGVHYTWRMDGPTNTRVSGGRFNFNKELLDPWAQAVTDAHWNRSQNCATAEATPSMRGIVLPEADDYDWQGDEQVHHASEQNVIYELHVGGFTRHTSSNVKHPGTFAGLIEKIPYLQSLGITAVELLPVMAFDEQDVPPSVAERGLHNYWGYSTHSFFSPHPGYCVTPLQGTHKNEFRDMVKALHKAGISVILDVVFNHTAEGGKDGPLINFKGMGNEIFYHLDTLDKSLYRDYTGCGNTFNCNHPLVANFIVDCLEYWVQEMHVDGFRFDLASVLVRGEDGNPMHHAPVTWAIEFSSILSQAHLIAEAWDAGGLYQVGGFPGYRWAEWNGRYRDLMRRFVRGDPGLIGEVATRISGSSDLYQPSGRLPINSINFITCHDGFTLYDSVSYHNKHNHANGEGNRDGHNDNLTWNCGAEGDTDDAEVLHLRHQQAKNFMAILMLSQGIPMLWAGDEVLRSQHGNNNAYCQDNELNWFDWELLQHNQHMLRFTREIIALRKRHPSLMRRRFLSGNTQPDKTQPDIVWHGRKLHQPLWDDPTIRILGFTLAGVGDDESDLHVLMNMCEGSFDMPLPDSNKDVWRLAVDTAQNNPHDIYPTTQQKPLSATHYKIQARSVVVFEN